VVRHTTGRPEKAPIVADPRGNQPKVTEKEVGVVADAVMPDADDEDD